MSRSLLRERREAAGLSLREVARRLGVSAAYLSDVERGHRAVSASNMEALSQIIGEPDPAALFEAVRVRTAYQVRRSA